MNELFLTTSAGKDIAVTLFEPVNDRKMLLLINSATGVKQQVYFSFARYFAEQDFTVITYDYSGIGRSKPEILKNSKDTMRSWAADDFKAVTDFIQEHYCEYSKFCVGHSVGALILGMNPASKIFEKFVFIGTQDAYLGHLNLKTKVAASAGFGIAVPVLSKLLGYFPAHWFGLGESLPSGVARDWRTLIFHPKSTSRLFDLNTEYYSKTLTQEVLIINAEDDSWVTKKGMQSLMSTAYPNLKPTYRELKVLESEKGEIGHINFFRSYNRNLWKIVFEAFK